MHLWYGRRLGRRSAHGPILSAAPVEVPYELNQSTGPMGCPGLVCSTCMLAQTGSEVLGSAEGIGGFSGIISFRQHPAFWNRNLRSSFVNKARTASNDHEMIPASSTKAPAIRQAPHARTSMVQKQLNLVVVLEDSCRFIKKCLGLVFAFARTLCKPERGYVPIS